MREARIRKDVRLHVHGHVIFGQPGQILIRHGGEAPTPEGSDTVRPGFVGGTAVVRNLQVGQDEVVKVIERTHCGRRPSATIQRSRRLVGYDLAIHAAHRVPPRVIGCDQHRLADMAGVEDDRYVAEGRWSASVQTPHVVRNVDQSVCGFRPCRTLSCERLRAKDVLLTISVDCVILDSHVVDQLKLELVRQPREAAQLPLRDVVIEVLPKRRELGGKCVGELGGSCFGPEPFQQLLRRQLGHIGAAFMKHPAELGGTEELQHLGCGSFAGFFGCCCSLLEKAELLLGLLGRHGEEGQYCRQQGQQKARRHGKC
mmetsp:Transcript_92525/g.220222  ORF Transcript_92525/g.220222 Transcript_92525/m.220222 type:complete len:314 (-) Transcript_92525:61-1002(-)